jgi:hypothetical protein
VIRYIDSVEKDNVFCIFLERLHGGELYGYILKDKHLDEYEAVHFLTLTIEILFFSAIARISGNFFTVFIRGSISKK